MLISPQHLQQQELYLETAMHHRIRAATPFWWGISQLELDESAISQGEVRLISLDAVMPDGTALRLGSNGAALPATRQAASAFTQHDESQTLYLGIPVQREGVANFDQIDTRDRPSPEMQQRIRFRVEARQVFDATRDQSPLTLQLATPRTRLLFKSDDHRDYVCLPLGEVQRNSDGNYIYRKSFVPPSVSISVSPWLCDQIREIHATSISVYRGLLDRRRQHDRANLDINASDTELFLRLGVLGAHIPGLAHLHEQKSLSPHAAYLILSQFAGQLCSLAVDDDPASIPSYKHGELHETFQPLVTLIKKLLGAKTKDRYIDIPLEARADGMWLGRLKEPRLDQCSQYVLAIETDIPAQEVASRVPTLAKIANFSQISDLIRNAVPGAELRCVHRPPSAIPMRPRHVYFNIAGNDRYWRDILKEKSFAFYVGQPFDSKRIKVSLMAILDA